MCLLIATRPRGSMIRGLFMAIYYATQIARSLVELGTGTVDEETFRQVVRMYGIVVEMYGKVLKSVSDWSYTVNDLFQNSKLYSEVEELDRAVSTSGDTRLIVLARNIRRAGGYAIALSDILVNKLVVDRTSALIGPRSDGAPAV